MTGLFWAFAAMLFGVAAFSLWRFFSNPVKVAWLMKIVASEAFKLALAEILKPEDPEVQAARIDAQRHNELLPTKQRPHPNEGGHR